MRKESNPMTIGSLAGNEFVTEYETSVIVLIEHWAVKAPERPGLRVGKSTLSYGEVNRQANQLARYLEGRGVRCGKLVGISLSKSLEMVISVLAVLKTGAAYVPIDPDHPLERILSVLDDCRPDLLITSNNMVEPFRRYCGDLLLLDAEDVNFEIAHLNGENLLRDISPDYIAYLIYTSGSTGQPKGALITHRNLASMYAGWDNTYGLNLRKCSLLQMASFSFDVFVGDLVRALCSGGELVLCPRQTLLDPAALYALMLQEHIDTAEFVPSVLNLLVEHLEQQGLKLHFMKLLMCSSDSWLLSDCLRAKALCGPDTTLINSYGITETTIDSTYIEVTAGLAEYEMQKPAPIGRPFPNTTVHVLDESMQPVSKGVPGELYLGGHGIGLGYWEQPLLTASRFVPDPFSAYGNGGRRLYRTGDIVKQMANDVLDYVGRSDQQVKIRGIRVEIGEIESKLRQHGQVREAAAVTITEGGEKRLVAFFVPANNGTWSKLTAQQQFDELRTFLAMSLLDAMIPSVFVELQGLPINANGKIDRVCLTEMAQTRISMPAKKNFDSPSSEAEGILQTIWEKTLGLQRVGLDDDFFQIGGNSISMIKVMSQAKQAGLRVTAKDFLVGTTIRKLAEKMNRSKSI